jgi:hypothetical protein
MIVMKKNGFAFCVILAVSWINLPCLAQHVPMELPEKN